MDDFSKRIEALSAEKRELLEIFLKEKKIDTEWMAETYVAPRDAVEEMLAGIWAQVLGVERVGIHDNFFAMGGDSILSIQIIAKAGEMGLRIHRNQLFEHPTIGELAPLVGAPSPAAAEEPEEEGPVPLTPSQRALLAAGAEAPLRSILLEVRAADAADAARLEEAARHLVERHDALRLRFERAEGTWRQLAADATAAFFTRQDLAGLDAADEDAAVRAAAARQHAGWDLSQAPLFRLHLAARGAEKPALLLVSAHPLVCDAESFRILLAELQTAYQQLSGGGVLRLAPASTSFRSWCRRLDRHAGTPELAAELERWLAQPAVPPLPVDLPGGRRESARTVTVTLDEAETRALLQDIPAAQRTQVTELLIAALAQAVASWTGTATVRFDLEGSARTESVLGADLSRTVGACSFLYPVQVSLEAVDSPGAALRAVKEQLRGVPDRGIGYSLLAGGAGPAGAAERLAALPPSSLLITYQPHLDGGGAGEASPFRVAGAELAGTATGPRSHPLVVAAGVSDGRVQMAWDYSEDLHHRATVEELAARSAAALRALIDDCLAGGGAGITPSDFPDAELSQGELGRLFGA
jgi:non-ribosomal peptide synthase protein (TIGR01720 family)